MPLPSNPRHFARNIAEGYVPFTRATLKQFTSSEIKVVYRNLELVVRELRSLAVPLEEIQTLQYKNQLLQRANHALALIRHHARRHRLVL